MLGFLGVILPISCGNHPLLPPRSAPFRPPWRLLGRPCFMAQRGLGFNFLYITAWFNLTWDLLWGPVLDQTEIRNGIMQCGGETRTRTGIWFWSETIAGYIREKFKCRLMKIWTIGKSKCHLPAARHSDLGVADLPDWYNFIKQPFPLLLPKKKHFLCSATPTAHPLWHC